MMGEGDWLTDYQRGKRDGYEQARLAVAGEVEDAYQLGLDDGFARAVAAARWVEDSGLSEMG